MHNTYTSKPARILFAGFFGIFSSSINKILLDVQTKEYNTKISTRPNTYDEEHNSTNKLSIANQTYLPNLPQNHPLSLVSRNFRNLAIKNPPNLRPNTIKSSIQHIVTQHLQNDDTYEQIFEQPHTTTFQSQNNPFLAHDEQTIWIPPPLKFPSSQPPNSNPHYPSFRFPPPDSPRFKTSSGMNSDTNSDISVFNTVSQFNNYDIETPI